MKKYIYAIIISLFFNVSTFAQEGVGIIAVVGGDAISSADVNERLRLAILSSGLQGQPGVKQKLLPQIVQVLVDEKLYAQAAETYNIEVTDAEVDQAVAGLEARNKIPAGMFPKFLAERGISIDTLKKQLKAELLRNRIITRKVRPKVTVTQRELEEKLEHISNHSGLAELNISEIVLPVDKPEDDNRVKELAQQLVAEIRKGAEFGAVAREFSRNTSAPNGGELGWLPQDQMSQALRSQIQNLAVGELSDPIRMDDGYFIIKLNDRRALVTSEQDESEVGLKQAFIPFGENASAAKKKEIIALVQDKHQHAKSCGDFAAFAKAVPSVSSPEMVMTQLKALKEDVRQVVAQTDVGKVSPIMQSKEGLYVFAVCEKTQAVPSLADTNRIREAVLREKIELQARRYVRDLRRNAFIEIRM